MVLDGALDPALPTIPLLEQQSVSLDAQLHQFFSQCVASSQCLWKPGSDPNGAFQALVARVRAAPVAVANSSRTVGPAEFLYGTADALYSPERWKYLAYSLQALATGDGTGILSLFDDYTERHSNGSYNNVFEANAAVNCLDVAAPSLAKLQAAVPAVEAAAPIYGLSNLYSETGCSVWPVPPIGEVGPIHANGSPPIVVVGSTGDPVTPYRWAQSLASELSNARLLTRVGVGHTAYGFSACIRSNVDSYLVNLTVPPPGTTCPSD
jgi:hypothetical protein